MAKVCYHCFASGRVQGVFYRASARAEARRLNIKGWARNLSDGRVEVMACGEEEDVKLLVAWLWQGPTAAQVSDVSSKNVAWQAFADFNTS